MIKEAIMVLAIYVPSGNATYGSESITSFPSMESCKTAMRVFRSSKSNQYKVVNGENSVTFSESIDWGSDRHYELKCIPLSDGT